MKSLKTLSILIVSLLLFSCTGKAQNKASINKKTMNKIEVIDFHSTRRCMTCNAIEANTKYTLETYFSKELKNKSITFLTVNVDDKKNSKMAEKFEATGTALFLNVIVDGKETQIDLTNFAFMKGTDKKAFSIELKSKLDKELKSI